MDYHIMAHHCDLIIVRHISTMSQLRTYSWTQSIWTNFALAAVFQGEDFYLNFPYQTKPINHGYIFSKQIWCCQILILPWVEWNNVKLFSPRKKKTWLWSDLKAQSTQHGVNWMNVLHKTFYFFLKNIILTSKYSARFATYF